MGEFVAVAAMMAMVKQVVDWLRYLRGGDRNAVLTQAVAWAAGYGAVVVFAHSAWATSFDFGGVHVNEMGWASQLIAGFAVGSSASVVKDAFKAVDQSQSGAVPPLLEPTRR